MQTRKFIWNILVFIVSVILLFAVWSLFKREDWSLWHILYVFIIALLSWNAGKAIMKIEETTVPQKIEIDLHINYTSAMNHDPDIVKNKVSEILTQAVKDAKVG